MKEPDHNKNSVNLKQTDDSEEIHDIDKTLRIKLDNHQALFSMFCLKTLYYIYLQCIA